MHFYRRNFVAPLLLSALLGQVRSERYIAADDDRLFQFVTRPEIRASRWKITTFHEDQIAPGYWFVAPYEFLDQPPDVGEPGWIGPHIYDNNGELVWSGASMFDNRNGEDFRISNVEGEDLMTMLYQHKGTGVIIDDEYEIRGQPKIDDDASKVNSHEFNFVENGTRALVIKNDEREAPEDQVREVGFDGRCFAKYEHFQELDTKTWEPVFDWDSRDHVRLSESTLTDSPIEDRCAGWDFFHSNSVEKTPNGDYLFSSRHTDTIYKVSGEDGHIIWRLGGKMSDFGQGDWTFSRQHDIRVRDHNATHLVVSILDNARGIDTQEPTYRCSRGLLLALDEEAMTVTILKQIDHPDGDGNYAPRRGNYQRLPDGNIWMGWSEVGIQSEHASDGTILMHARMTADWLGTYRTYKFNFTGHPTEKPAVNSTAYMTESGSSATVAYVSWNGATEVAFWNMYKTTVDGEIRVMIGSTERTGFESVVEHGKLASYVVFEAVAKNGEILGMSEVTKTVKSANITDEAISEEKQWMAAIRKGRRGPFFKNRLVIFLLGAISGAMTALTIWVLSRRGVLTRVNVPRWFPALERYERLGERDQEEGVSFQQSKAAGMDAESLPSKSKISLDSLDHSERHVW